MGEGALQGLFYKDTNRILHSSALRIWSPPKGPISLYHHIGGISIYEFFWKGEHLLQLGARCLLSLPCSPLLCRRYPSRPCKPVTTLLSLAFPPQDVRRFLTPSLDLVLATKVRTQCSSVSRCPCGISQRAYLPVSVAPGMEQGTCTAGGIGRWGRDANNTELPLFSKRGCIRNANPGQSHTALALLGNANSPANRAQGRKQKPRGDGRGSLTAWERWWQIRLGP